VYDISNPKAPKIQGGNIETGTTATDQCAAMKTFGANNEHMALLGSKGMTVWSLGQPKSPAKKSGNTPINTQCWGLNAALSMAISPCNQYMYCVGGSGLALLDMSNPYSPRTMGATMETGVTGGNSGASLCIGGSDPLKLFLAGQKGLVIYDISDAGRPVKMNQVDTGVIALEGMIDTMIVKKSDSKERFYILGGKGLAYSDNLEGRNVEPFTTLEPSVMCPKGPAGLCHSPGVIWTIGGNGFENFDENALV